MYNINTKSTMNSNSNEQLERFKELYKKKYYNKLIHELDSYLHINKKNSEIFALMGLSFLRISNFDEASKYLLKSLDINNHNPEVNNALGVALVFLNKEYEAIEYFKKAFDLNSNLRDPINNLLELYDKTNNKPEFQKLAEFSIKKYSDDAIIKFYYAQTFIQKQKLDEASNYLEKIDFKNYDIAWEIKKFYQLAQINDGLKKFTKAFNFAKIANDKTLNSLKKNKNKKNKFHEKIDQYLLNITKKKNKNLNFSKKSDYNLFFLIGFPRSGTTLLDSILRSHPEILITEEKPMVEKMRLKLNSLNKKISEIDENIQKILSTLYFDELKKHLDINEKNNKIIIDRHPLNSVEIELIQTIFPQAKFIYTVRHPLDSILSAYMHHFRLNPATENFLNLSDTAIIYNKIQKLLLNYKKTSEFNFYDIKYEDIIIDFENSIKKLIKFMNLKWSNELINFYKTAKKRDIIRTASYKQVIQPIYKSSLYKWKNYKSEIETIFPQVSKWIKYYNY